MLYTQQPRNIDLCTLGTDVLLLDGAGPLDWMDRKFKCPWRGAGGWLANWRPCCAVASPVGPSWGSFTSLNLQGSRLLHQGYPDPLHCW